VVLSNGLPNPQIDEYDTLYPELSDDDELGTPRDLDASNRNDNGSFSCGCGLSCVVHDKYKNCSSYAEDGFRCVPFHACKDGFIITDGSGIFNPRFNIDGVELNPETSKCPGALETCCRHPDLEDIPSIITEIEYNPPVPCTPAPTTTTSTTTVRPLPPREPIRCGVRNPFGISVRILDTSEDSKSAGFAQFGEWPHMCAVLNRQDLDYLGGASLIADNTILTAAHILRKVTDVSNILIRCGDWDVQSEVEPYPHQIRVAKEMRIHPEFHENTLTNDFAVVITEEAFDLTDPHIDTICLPGQSNDYDYDDDYPNFDVRLEGLGRLGINTSNCVTTGWGKDKFGDEGEYQVVLKGIELPMVDHDTCQSQLRKTRLGPDFDLDESFNCAGGEEGKDACKGDGGGPLMCPDKDGFYHLTGLVAWGVGCGDKDVPGVYADVNKALCFIDWATKCSNVDLNLDLDHCEQWAQNRNFSLEQELEELRSTGRRRRRQRIIESFLSKYDDAFETCHSDDDYYIDLDARKTQFQ